jgi:hypothetical protein
MQGLRSCSSSSRSLSFFSSRFIQSSSVVRRRSSASLGQREPLCRASFFGTFMSKADPSFVVVWRLDVARPKVRQLPKAQLFFVSMLLAEPRLSRFRVLPFQTLCLLWRPRQELSCPALNLTGLQVGADLFGFAFCSTRLANCNLTDVSITQSALADAIDSSSLYSSASE